MISQLSFCNFGVSLKEKIAESMAFLRDQEARALKFNPDGFWLAFSGGKDSMVIERLARMAGVKFRAVYNQTTIDPPELVRFIKQYYPHVEWNRPDKNFFYVLATKKGLPSRISRWCCEVLKEHGGDGYHKIIGVRAAESIRRRITWKPVSPARDGKSGDRICPILYWSDEEVWGFIHQENLPYCSLYDEGFKRIGCVGCPMAGEKRREEFDRWPGFEKAWRTATNKYFNSRKGTLNTKGKPWYIERFASGDEFFAWWMSDNPTPQEREDECLGLFDD